MGREGVSLAHLPTVTSAADMATSPSPPATAEAPLHSTSNGSDSGDTHRASSAPTVGHGPAQNISETRTLVPMSEEAKKLQEIYEERESWCMVERHPTQYWCRAQRKHFPQHLRSALNDQPPPCYEPRCSWAVVTPRHREKRHFADAGKGHLV